MANCEHCSDVNRVLRFPNVKEGVIKAITNGELNPGYTALLFGIINFLGTDDLSHQPQHEHGEFHQWVAMQAEEGFDFDQNPEVVVGKLIQLYPPKG